MLIIHNNIYCLYNSTLRLYICALLACTILRKEIDHTKNNLLHHHLLSLRFQTCINFKERYLKDLIPLTPTVFMLASMKVNGIETCYLHSSNFLFFVFSRTMTEFLGELCLHILATVWSFETNFEDHNRFQLS